MSRQTTIHLERGGPRRSLQIEQNTEQQVSHLMRWGYGKNLTEVIRHAIREAWERQIDKREVQMATIANEVYSAVYGELDDRHLRARKTQEIQDWLDSGDLRDHPALDQLIAEWCEYDADEIRQRTSGP